MKHRLFISLDLPENCRQEVADLQNQLDKLKLPVIWKKVNQLHLTLNFLGQVSDENLNKINIAIQDSIKEFAIFSLQPLYLETLYSRHDPTILYLSLDKSEELIALQRLLAESLSEITPQPRRFLPHITVGHLSRTDPVSTKRFTDIVSDFPVPKLSSFVVEKLILYESLVSRSGHTYQKLASFMLKSGE